MSPSPFRLHTPTRMLMVMLLVVACGPGVLEPVALRISVVEGDGQVDSVLAVLPIPLRVQVQDQHNQPMSGVEVRWHTYPADGTLSSATSVTDAQGFAAVTYALGSRMGPHYVGANATGRSSPPAWFEVTAGPGAAARMEWSFGGDDLGVPGAALDQYGVVITDDYGNPVSDVMVDWLVTEGGGSVQPAQSTSTSGQAAATRHTLGPLHGRQTVLAVANGLPGSPQLAFTATAVAAMVRITEDDSYECYYSGTCPAAIFAPTAVRIGTGQSVGWRFSSYMSCNVVFEDDPTTPASSTIRRTGTHMRTFTEPGLYRYRCTLFSSDFLTGMVGAVEVQ
jgi:plastocyanin